MITHSGSVIFVVIWLPSTLGNSTQMGEIRRLSTRHLLVMTIGASGGFALTPLLGLLHSFVLAADPPTSPTHIEYLVNGFLGICLGLAICAVRSEFLASPGKIIVVTIGGSAIAYLLIELVAFVWCFGFGQTRLLSIAYLEFPIVLSIFVCASAFVSTPFWSVCGNTWNLVWITYSGIAFGILFLFLGGHKYVDPRWLLLASLGIALIASTVAIVNDYSNSKLTWWTIMPYGLFFILTFAIGVLFLVQN